MSTPTTAADLPELPLDATSVDALRAAVAGLDAGQLYWASGYLAGLAAAGQPAPATAVGEAPRLTVLYGTQTGNGRRLAERLARDAAAGGLSVTSVSMADYPPARLKQERLLLVVVSTHGEGEPPDDAIELYEFLGSRRARGLDELRYAVLALGDSSYEHFCQTGRDFDERLTAAGARRLAPLAECDVDFEEPAATWSARTLAEVTVLLAQAEASGPAPLLRAVPPAPRWSRSRPYAAEVLACQPVVGRGSSKRVLHLELALGDSGLSYRPGDAVGVVAPNPGRLVDELLDAAGLSGDEPLGGADGGLREALAQRYEITVSSRRFLEGWAAHTGSAELQARLAAGGPALRAWLWRHQIVDILRRHPGRIEADGLVALLRRMPPRLYSIASSQTAVGDEVHLTVAEVAYEAWGRAHWGATSSWIAGSLRDGGTARIFIEPNERFRLPADPAAPIVMIGPGTGVAPFRGFLQEREAAGATGANWLFFGDRHFESDFLYQAEWLRYRKQGLLTRLDVAFSRDGPAKRYVQHAMAERAAELYRWIEEGATVYVCGDAERMAPDVDAMLGRIIREQSGCDESTASERLRDMRRDGRYLRDVY